MQRKTILAAHKVLLTTEVVELMQCLHDDGDERQVELSEVGSDLRVLVARVCIMAAQQGVNSTDSLFMEEENPAGDRIHWSLIAVVLLTECFKFH